MVWAGQFSDHINYTALNNAAVGTMKPFFTSDISVQLALAASYPPEMLSRYIREVLLYIETGDTGLKQRYTQLFDIIFSYFLSVDQLLRLTKADTEYNAILINHIKAKLVPLADRAFSYYKSSLVGTAAQRLVVASSPLELHIFYEPVMGHRQAIDFGLPHLSNFWYPKDPDFNTYYLGIPGDTTIFGGLTSFQAKIKYIIQHNFFTSILDEITASATFIGKLAEKYLANYLSDWPDHRPNYALYLTWLQLLEATKTHLNGLTGRHLDFYYEKVLQLKALAQSADKAYLVLELNRITASYAIKDNTVFMGPKDGAGNIILYGSTRETVLNKAKIKHLSSLYYGDAEDNIGTQINEGRLFAAPIGNSADGLGEKLTDEVIAWHPFHIKEYVNAELANIHMPKAEIGFAVASHYLRLNEGLRTITLEISISNTVKFNAFGYQAFVTTEKEWLGIDDKNLTLTKTGTGNVTKLTFVFTVPADQDPVVAYNQEVHLGRLTATEPVLKIVPEHFDTQAFIYDTLSNANISEVNLSVKVGEVNGTYNADGIKNLELHSDRSRLDPSKPIQPWGPEPKFEDSFIVGSEEVFYKENAKIQLNFEWNDDSGKTEPSIGFGFSKASDSGSTGLALALGITEKEVEIVSLPTADILTLSNNKWESLEAYQDVKIFKTVQFPKPNFIQKVALEIDLSSKNETLFYAKNDVWEGYRTNTNKGFIKVKLNDDFGHDNYYRELLIFAKDKNDDTPPVYPYQPTLLSFSLSYEAACSSSLTTVVDFVDRPLEFYHSGPFGESERHKALQNGNIKLLNRLISTTGGVYKAQGSLFIGLENLLPEDTQAILFQLQEGSEDPLLEKPEDHLKWEYLATNGVWKTFDEEGVGDNTSGLIESGIINFIIPKDASLTHTAFESNLIWIRCSVKEAPDAVCKIIGIYPNTIEVTRIIPEETEYETMMAPAGEIKKLLVPEAKVKKIEQPFTSFDGTPKEGDESFYLRASERLRHKNRAITIWDFERLVLQAFPEIYKVRCLNHTQIGGSLSEGDLVYNEVAPGHVSVITIPNLAHRNDIDPLKPYTKKSTLKNIEEFLKERSSCQVTIHTAQPDFEEVKVKCTITLRNEFSDTTYYKEVIQNDLVNFLSPWVFTSDTDLNFGGRIHQSVLIDFIEELPYVDFLTDFELIHIKSSGEITKVDEAIASTARSILVSVPAIEHDLTVILKVPETIPEIACNDE